MKLLIVAAMAAELDLLRSELGAEADPARCHGGLWRTTGPGGNMHLATVGIGPVNAALELGLLIQRLAPERMIMVGSAGAFEGAGLEIGRVMAAGWEVMAELGLTTGPGLADGPALALPGVDQKIDLDPGLTSAVAGAAGIGVGGLLTVAGVSANPGQASARAERFGALAENMEGYALALAAARHGIPAAEVRGISNLAGDRDKTRWRLGEASTAAQTAVLTFLRSDH